MTTWTSGTDGGRERGVRGLVRAWVTVLVRPRHFFRTGIGPGDQAPGLTFFLTVVLIAEAIRFSLVTDAYWELPVARPLAGVFWLALVVLLLAPLALHFVAALQTLLLIPVVSERAGTSQTVQVIAYSTAPCVFTGLPIPELRVICTMYGALLLVLGIRIVHDTTTVRAIIAGAVPALLIFGYGFRGLAALSESSLPVPV